MRVAYAGLSLEVPSGWTQIEQGTWIAPADHLECAAVAGVLFLAALIPLSVVSLREP